MAYCVGDAQTVNAPPRAQYTVQGDSFYSLGKAYGVSPTAIIQMQPGLRGVPINNKTVQAFIKTLPGWSRALGLRPYKAGTKSSDNPGTVGPDGKPEGFAQFTSDTQLMLPDMPRLDGKTPRGVVGSGAAQTTVDDTEVAVQQAGIFGVSPLVFFGASGLLLAVLLLREKRAKKTQHGQGST
jgi:hypothetical protein